MLVVDERLEKRVGGSSRQTPSEGSEASIAYARHFPLLRSDPLLRKVGKGKKVGTGR